MSQSVLFVQFMPSKIGNLNCLYAAYPSVDCMIFILPLMYNKPIRFYPNYTGYM